MPNRFFFKALLSSLVFLFSFSAFASGPNLSSATIISAQNPNTPCWVEAGRYHGVDPWLLYSMAHVESRFNPKALNTSNSNGTKDVGLMQINSTHFATLRRQNIREDQLLNACVSTYVGAWILAEKIKVYGHSWRAIAAYNVGSLGTPGRVATGRKYAAKVNESYQMLTNKYGVGSGYSNVWAVN